MCQDLSLAPPFTARVFADAVERRWHLQVVMEPVPSGEYTTGWCLVDGSSYTIYYYAGGSVVQRERILFHELSHIVMGHVRGKQPRAAMRKGHEHLQRERTLERQEQEQAVEQVARALVAYSMLGDPTPGHVSQPVPPLSAYGQFIDSLLAR
jgi:hypothetical protein